MSSSSPTVDLLEGTIGDLGVALDAGSWLDGNHLVPARGGAALDRIVHVLQQLSTVTLTAPKGQPATYSGWVVSAMLGLSESMRILDANLISENLANPANATALPNGKTQFTAGDTALSSSQFAIAGTAYDASGSSSRPRTARAREATPRSSCSSARTTPAR